MYELVVLCAIFASAVAKPDLLVTLPLENQYSTYIAPVSTTITKQASSVIHPSPLVYSAPLAYTHFIKKRSPQLPISFIGHTSYVAPNTLAATTYAAPVVHPASVIPAIAPAAYTAHLIKKRSAPLLATSYVAPTTYTATAPLITSYAATSPLIASPHLISHPITYTHLIKKRSAPLLTTYLAPTSVSHQSRIDLHSTPYVTSYATPITYSSPVAISSSW